MLPVVTGCKRTRSILRVRTTSPGYSITLRLIAEPRVHARGLIVSAVAKAGGIVTALDVAEPTPGSVKVDLSCDARDSDHVAQIVAALDAIEGCRVAKVSDRVFLAHLGGKLEIAVKAPMRHRDDLARIYTPGVARVCEAIAEHPEDVRRLTIKRNTVAVVTDGSAVLGLGDIGPAAAMPVMEGKAALFKRFANIDAWPICIDSNDVDEIVRTVELISVGFGGVNLEDIAAPRCFEIESRLRERLDIPVFHDDQHGTAIVVVAALRNALRLVGKSLPHARIVMSGAGAAGTAVCQLLLTAGATDIVMYDLDGALHRGRTDLDPLRTALLTQMNPRNVTAPLGEALREADVFIGLSAPGAITAGDVAGMAADAIVFALANPDPEIDPVEAAEHALVVATGRSDYPNQINNVLAFPGVFRGMLDAGGYTITDEVLLAAAEAIADCVGDDELSSVYIVPSVFHPDVTKRVATAVRRVVERQRGDSIPPIPVSREADDESLEDSPFSLG